ncbi:MAG: beta-ketoacyl-[acyl-carrier-protein] synthase family protein [Bacteroidota bacterium]|nr:beta-ketoacyl-[acyl-carrier-protein] synthase family protein [Bacteroidota bacterium]
MGSRVFITGTGIISAIGNNVEETHAALLSKKSGIGKLENFSTRHHGYLAVGEIKEQDDLLKLRLGLNVTSRYSRTALLGMIAAREAIKSAGITNIRQYRTGIVSATSVGGMAVAENHFTEYLDPDDDNEFLDYINTLDCSDSTERIADYLGITDYLTTISTACSSSANSIMFGARLIKLGLVDRVIAGGTDSLSRFTVNGFMSLKILDEEPCKPFDANRKGLNLGEGAGYIVMESEAASRGKKIICELSGYGNVNDAYHQTASSPEGKGAFAAMQKAFSVNGIVPDQVDYINAHGTGTEVNDLSEGLALQKIFGTKIPSVSSTKAFTGHTLAAAGGIEAVISILALQHNTIYPNLNFNTAMPETGIIPVQSVITGKIINTVLSNSFGFGGNTSSLLFSRTLL